MKNGDSAHPSAVATTVRREWLGFFGSFLFLYFFGYNYDDVLNSDYYWYPTAFFGAVAGVMLVCGLLYSDDPKGLSRLASIAGPAGTACAFLTGFCPEPANIALYIASGALLAPAVARRCYGVLRTAPGSRRLTAYISAVALTVLCHSLWIYFMTDLAYVETGIRLLIPSAMSVFGWLAAGSVAAPAESGLLPPSFRPGRQVIPIAVAFVLLLVLDTASTIIHTLIIAEGEDGDALYWFLGMILAAAGFMCYAWMSDRGRERGAFFIGMLLMLAGLFISFIPGETYHSVLLPVSVADGFGGIYTEFFILTMPVFFLAGTRRPVLVCALGIVLDVALNAVMWIAWLWLPPALLESLGPPVIVFAALSAIAFIGIALYLFERRRETSLAAVIGELARSAAAPHEYKAAAEASETAEAAEAAASVAPEEAAPVIDSPSLVAAGFAPGERKVASLLIEGYTKGEIARKLHLKSDEVADMFDSIRGKVTGARQGGDEEVFARVTREFGLTDREIQVLRGIYEGRTNRQIAEQHFISDATVKFHARNLMKKLPVSSRYEITDWLTGYRD